MFSNLSILDLSRNKIRQIKHTPFFALHSLTSLFLDRNYISYIHHGAFDKLTNLANLDLANNHLKVLNFRWFINMKSLSSLHLEDNRIERVESWMHHWRSSLKRVSPNNNRIPVILPKQAELFNLDGNPIYCGCRPENFNLNDISNLTFCKVRMQCNSITLKGNCKNKVLPEEVYTFWKDISAKPVCQEPVTKELAIVRNHDGLSLKCAATGIPAPDITLYSGDMLQKIEANGVETTNFTSITINQIHSTAYNCNASNILGGMTKNLDPNEVTSEVPILQKRNGSRYIIPSNNKSDKITKKIIDLGT